MRTFNSPDAFLRFLETRPAAVEAAEHHGLDVAGKALVKGAQAMIGEEVREWPALAARTVQEKEALGYTGRISETDPLYRTGELRTSITHEVHEHAVTIGSTDPVAAFQEFGTAGSTHGGPIPPRPFIGSTMFRDGHAAADLVAGHVVAALVGDPPPHHDEHHTLTGR